MDNAALQRRFQDAMNHLAANERHQARLALQDILRERPEHVESRLTLGVLLGGEGERKEARRHLRLGMEELRANPKTAGLSLRGQILVNLCALALEDDDWQEVLAWEEEFGDTHDALHRQGLLGQSASVLFDAGNRAVKEGAVESARTLYERALSLEPDFGEAWYNLAVIASEGGDFQAAIRALENALLAEDTFADAHFLLGTLLLPTDPLSAIEHMSKAVDLSPKNARWTTLLGSAFARQRNFHRSRELFLRAIELDESHADAHLGLALASRAVGDADAARASLKRAFELNPRLAAQIQQMKNELG